jgi:hypothetical protein
LAFCCFQLPLLLTIKPVVFSLSLFLGIIKKHAATANQQWIVLAYSSPPQYSEEEEAILTHMYRTQNDTTMNEPGSPAAPLEPANITLPLPSVRTHFRIFDFANMSVLPFILDFPLSGPVTITSLAISALSVSLLRSSPLSLLYFSLFICFSLSLALSLALLVGNDSTSCLRCGK